MEITAIDDAKLRPCPLCGGHATSHSFDGYVIIRCLSCGFSTSSGPRKWNAMPRITELENQLRFAEAVAEKFIQLTPPYFIQPGLQVLINEWRKIQNNSYENKENKE